MHFALSEVLVQREGPASVNVPNTKVNMMTIRKESLTCLIDSVQSQRLRVRVLDGGKQLFSREFSRVSALSDIERPHQKVVSDSRKLLLKWPTKVEHGSVTMVDRVQIRLRDQGEKEALFDSFKSHFVYSSKNHQSQASQLSQPVKHVSPQVSPNHNDQTSKLKQTRNHNPEVLKTVSVVSQDEPPQGGMSDLFHRTMNKYYPSEQPRQITPQPPPSSAEKEPTASQDLMTEPLQTTQDTQAISTQQTMPSLAETSQANSLEAFAKTALGQEAMQVLQDFNRAQTPDPIPSPLISFSPKRDAGTSQVSTLTQTISDETMQDLIILHGPLSDDDESDTLTSLKARFPPLPTSEAEKEWENTRDMLDLLSDPFAEEPGFLRSSGPMFGVNDGIHQIQPPAPPPPGTDDPSIRSEHLSSPLSSALLEKGFEELCKRVISALQASQVPYYLTYPVRQAVHHPYSYPSPACTRCYPPSCEYPHPPYTHSPISSQRPPPVYRSGSTPATDPRISSGPPVTIPEALEALRASAQASSQMSEPPWATHVRNFQPPLSSPLVYSQYLPSQDYPMDSGDQDADEDFEAAMAEEAIDYF